MLNKISQTQKDGHQTWRVSSLSWDLDLKMYKYVYMLGKVGHKTRKGTMRQEEEILRGRVSSEHRTQRYKQMVLVCPSQHLLCPEPLAGAWSGLHCITSWRFWSLADINLGKVTYLLGSGPGWSSRLSVCHFIWGWNTGQASWDESGSTSSNMGWFSRKQSSFGDLV